jgi:hypothetical protein
MAAGLAELQAYREVRCPPLLVAVHTATWMSSTQLRLPIDDTDSPLTDEEVAELRADLFAAMDHGSNDDQSLDAKDVVRMRHRRHRSDAWRREFATIGPQLPSLLADFASGQDVIPEHIDPTFEIVAAGTRDADLFRLVTLLWSVPVSRGYGRRMRFLVRDRANGKVIGVFALGDPVFNLGARDRWVGWSADDRRLRLVNVMDAFVVGAVPPYSYLLGGKLVFSLIGSAEVGHHQRAEKITKTRPCDCHFGPWKVINLQPSKAPGP